MKKAALVGVVIVVFAAYAIFHNSQAALPASTTKNNGTKVSDSAASTTQSGTYRNGTYTGSGADAFYGTIQVQATIQHGKLADVQFLQYPNDRSESVQVNQQAMPMLKQEAIQVQNANVDVVSGATQTSQAFKESLADALSQAK